MFRFGLGFYDSVQLGWVWFGFVLFRSVWFGSVWFSSVCFGSVRFGSVRFGSVRFGSFFFVVLIGSVCLFLHNGVDAALRFKFGVDAVDQ